MKAPFIIGDVGSNHRGSLECALLHITAAKQCGLDAIKFQLYDHESLYGLPGKLDYELPREWIPKLKACADENKIEFMCSAFSAQDYAFIDPYVSIHKIASSEALCPIIREAVIKTQKTFIVSTGGLSAPEVDYLIQENQSLNWALLECVANYPAPTDQYNLSAMKHWGLRVPQVGVSDHTVGETLGAAAVAFGATIFEKHFDASDSDIDTPDSPVSATAIEMDYYVHTIHEAFRAIGSGHKSPAHQHASLLRYRRRPILTKDLRVGDVLELNNNYGNYRSLKDDTRGAPAQTVFAFNGKTLNRDMKKGTPLWFSDLV